MRPRSRGWPAIGGFTKRRCCVPHPYRGWDGGVLDLDASEMVSTKGWAWSSRFVCRMESLIGASLLEQGSAHSIRAELGYWIGADLLESRLLHRGGENHRTEIRL